MGAAPSFLVIGNPENRRVTFFQECLRQAEVPPATVLPYLTLLNAPGSLMDCLSPNTIIRIESPGESWEVEQRIIAWGGSEEAMHRPHELGRIAFSAEWFRGFTRLMGHVAATIEEYSRSNPGTSPVWFNHPDDIVTMLDKSRAKTLCANFSLPACPAFTCYDEFFTYVEKQKHRRYFVKLNSSSSASGIVAYEFNPHLVQEQITTTVEFQPSSAGNRFFNSLKVRKYRDRHAIRTILDFLFSEGALVERWLPKVRHEGYVFDLRVMGIARERCHSIGRLSRSPFTNLHLGNRRCPVEDLPINAELWEKIDRIVHGTMECFPRSVYAGLDILLPVGGGDPVLLEVNCFGDLLPGLLCKGFSTYQAELAAVGKRTGHVS